MHLSGNKMRASAGDGNHWQKTRPASQKKRFAEADRNWLKEIGGLQASFLDLTFRR